MTGEEVQRRLVDFARKWSLYAGSERAEAQTFLNELSPVAARTTASAVGHERCAAPQRRIPNSTAYVAAAVPSATGRGAP